MALPALNTTSNVIRPLQSTVVTSLYEAIPISMGSLTSEEQVFQSAGEANTKESVPMTGSVQQPKTYGFCDHLLTTISYRGSKQNKSMNTVLKLTPFNLTQRNLVRLRHNDRLRPGLDQANLLFKCCIARSTG